MRNLIISVALIAASLMSAQVGVDTSSPQGALDIVSSNSGLVVPRVANEVAVTVPSTIENGTIIYDKGNDCVKGYTSSGWSDCFGMPTTPSLPPALNTNNEVAVSDTTNETIAVLISEESSNR